MFKATNNAVFRRVKSIQPLGGPGGADGFGPELFNLPLQDAGNGAVSLVPYVAIGSATPTYTGASVKWAKLKSGLWAQVATGIARAHYLGRDTVVGAYGGYLSEPAGIQLVTPTASIRDMTGTWVAVGITPAKTATGIDGAANAATTLTATAPNGTILQTLVAAASARTYSVFMRRKTGAGTILIQQGATTLDVTALLNLVTYTRVELNASVLNSAFGILMATSGDAIEVDFNQFEALASTQFASSPMASAGAARAADVLTFPSAGNVDFTQGTAYAELTTNYSTSPAVLYAIAATSNGRPLYISIDPSTNIRIFDGTTSVTKNVLSDMSTGARKRASSWGAGGMFVTGDGAAPTTGAFDGTIGSGASIEVGHAAGGNQWNGCIRSIRIFPTQVPSAVLQSITA